MKIFNFLFRRLYMVILIIGLLIADVSESKSQHSADQQNQIETSGLPAQLDIRAVSDHSIRITLKPVAIEQDFPDTPVLVEHGYPKPVISLREIDSPVKEKVGNLTVEVMSNPLLVRVTNAEGKIIQELAFRENGTLDFQLDEHPVLGLGEGGPRPSGEYDWRKLPVEYDRRGRFHNMHPRWQSDAYGSRNPVAFMVGTSGWGLFISTPWGEIDLEDEEKGTFIPRDRSSLNSVAQTRRNQHANRGQGIPPLQSMVPGLYDIFVFDASDPTQMMADAAMISGKAVMPPKWSLGYMQSHRTLEDDEQIVEIAETFREKQIPVDAVIYLGTGFTPRGWNKEQPSFEFNPEVFNRDPEAVIDDIHELNMKFIVHMIPWDRHKLPTLHGNIPAEEGETVDAGHLKSYWQQHEELVSMGVDAWWPDEGDWFNLHERIKRHQLYYQGPLSTEPNERPWSLHRNGHLGIAKWGGWVWSGDTQSTWKTLEAQIAVGLNHSLSLSPYWGSDIGGFYSTQELDGELFARWYQFGAFNPSFRSHGRAWWTRLPWGWGLDEPGPLEGYSPNVSALGDDSIEPITKQYTELRYRLMPYTYSLAWQAHHAALPFMRPMWLHYPDDEYLYGIGDQYLWGRDMLIAPVYEEGAQFRQIYLPEGQWYDWWTNDSHSGGKEISRDVDLSIMPIYVRAGAIIPLDPVRQYVDQEVSGPMTLRIYPGNDGEFELYNDDGNTLDYLDGEYQLTRLSWDDSNQVLSIEPAAGDAVAREFRIEVVGQSGSKSVDYRGKRIEVQM